MATLTIHDLDPATEEQLRFRAEEHGLSVEDEARRLLQSALLERPPMDQPGLYRRIRDRFQGAGWADDIELPLRGPTREPPDFR